MVRIHSTVIENLLKGLQSVSLLRLDKLLQITLACLGKDVHVVVRKDIDGSAVS